MIYTPNYVRQGQEWRLNTDGIQMEGKPLFQSDDGVPVFHGDTYFAMPDWPEVRVLSAIAHWKFNYNDGRWRVKIP